MTPWPTNSAGSQSNPRQQIMDELSAYSLVKHNYTTLGPISSQTQQITVFPLFKQSCSKLQSSLKHVCYPHSTISTQVMQLSGNCTCHNYYLGTHSLFNHRLSIWLLVWSEGLGNSGSNKCLCTTFMLLSPSIGLILKTGILPIGCSMMFSLPPINFTFICSTQYSNN